MAATTLVRDFIWRVSSLLNDSAPQYTTWLESEIVMALNDGQIAIAKFLPFTCTRTDAIKLVPGCLQSLRAIPAASIVAYDGQAAPAAGSTVNGRQLVRLDCNMGADGATPGLIIRTTDRDDLDTVDPSWQTKTGTAVRMYAYDPNTPTLFLVSPGVAAGTPVYVRASYVVNPVPVPAGNDAANRYSVANGTDVTTRLSIDDSNVDDLMNYVLARVNMKDDASSKPQYVQIYGEEFTASINAQVQAITGVNPNLKRLPMSTGTIGSGS